VSETASEIRERATQYMQHNMACQKVVGRRVTKESQWGELSYDYVVDDRCCCTCGLSDLLALLAAAQNATDANARLASTAAQRDELLAALKALVEDYELLLGDGLTDSTAPSLLNAANAAIAKAEGK
jgi:hypothetical protein